MMKKGREPQPRGLSMLDKLLRWIELPIQALFWISLVAGFLLMFHVSVDVGGRAAFNRPFVGTTEIVAAWYMIAVAFLPWAWVARNDLHITADLFSRIGSRRFGFWLGILVKLVTASYGALFAWQTTLRAIQQTGMNEAWEAGGGYIAVWPSRWILPISAALMVVYLLLRALADIRRGDSEEGGSGR